MESRQDLVDQLGAAMQQYQRSVQAFDDAVGRRLGLGPAEVRCLDWLADGPKTAGAISEATGLRPAATTALIDRLEHKGYVSRTRPGHDRRTVLVEMTPYGRDKTWECYGPLVEEGLPLLAALSPEQLTLMRDHLRAITRLTDDHRDRMRS